MGFHNDIVSIIDFYTDRIERLKIFDKKSGEEKPIEGISFVIDADHEDKTLTELNSLLNNKGFFTFLTDKDHTNHEYSRIGIMRVTDPYKVIQFKQTNGTKIETEDIIKQLKEWEQRYSFRITGIDFNWIELKFNELPNDLSEFVSEVYKFCPDTVNQLHGSTNKLMDEIQIKKKLFLWWD